MLSSVSPEYRSEIHRSSLAHSFICFTMALLVHPSALIYRKLKPVWGNLMVCSPICLRYYFVNTEGLEMKKKIGDICKSMMVSTYKVYLYRIFIC